MMYAWNVYNPGPGGAWNEILMVRTASRLTSVNLCGATNTRLSLWSPTKMYHDGFRSYKRGVNTVRGRGRERGRTDGK